MSLEERLTVNRRGLLLQSSLERMTPPALRALSWLVRSAPDAWQDRFASLVGDLGFWLLGPMRRRSVSNAARLLEGEPRHAWAVARESWRNYTRALLGFVRLANMAPAELDRLAGAVPGWEWVEEAFARGKGVILVSCHFGTWDLSAAIMAHRYPVTVVVDRLTNPLVNRLATQVRAAKGISLVSIEQGVRPLLRALLDNQAIGLMVDRPLESGGVPVRFFGQITRVPAGAGALARQTGATILPAFGWRDERLRFHAELQEPVSYSLSGDKERDIREISQRIFDRLEAMVRRYPEQWFMFRDMWPASLQRADGLGV